ncbi:hypothetical protein CTI12_AA580100 [Artemisia annua]|uniref:Uncharacterized protein n=1 Tax=Artemisia annua TaxID=35608 RepID=A0A2U1KPD7_ARTAN|nr:hypothetical protein CTI12_AA580100 [Artemisia annua]
MYAMVLVLVVITSTSSTLCVSSNNDVDQEIFMVVDDQTTMHHAGMGISKVLTSRVGRLIGAVKGFIAMVFLKEDVIQNQAVVLRAVVALYSAHAAIPIHAAELHEAAFVSSLVCYGLVSMCMCTCM